MRRKSSLTDRLIAYCGGYQGMPKIQIVLTDDWELRGDGSGDMRALQFEPLQRLLSIYERHGLRATILAEVMQQQYHRQIGNSEPQLQTLADEWEEQIRSAVTRGHDVQLHLHPQWIGATFTKGRWHLPGDWSLFKHAPEEVRRLIRKGKLYLEELIRPLKPDYGCIAFRAGGWCIAPSDHLLSILAEEGIRYDLSIVQGVRYDNARICLDYRRCEEGFLPFYPDTHDARKLAAAPGPIVCLPTVSFREPFGYRARRDLTRLLARLQRTRPPRSNGSNDYGVWKTTLFERLRVRLVPAIAIADLSCLDIILWRRMLDTLRQRAVRSDRALTPVVLTNHTKDLRDFKALESFAADMARQPDLEVITMADLHANFQRGLYQPVVKSSSK
jgi:hypothetical protein